MFRRILTLIPILTLSLASLSVSAQPIEEEEEELMPMRSVADDGSNVTGGGGPAAECSLSCPDGSEAQATRDGGCGCGLEGEIRAAVHRCSAEGCAATCAPNQCVGWRPSATGSCNYSCLMNARDPDRTPN